MPSILSRCSGVKWILVSMVALFALLQSPSNAGASSPQPTDPRSTVALGKSHSCAISATDGKVFCWGRGTEGQMGNGSFSLPSAVAVEVAPPVSSILELVSGSDHVCALRRDGTVWCWGKNDRGQLGDGSTRNSALPVRAGQLTQIKWITAGAQHTCALKDDGSTLCWGDNSLGQIGGLSGAILPSQVSTPTLVLDAAAPLAQPLIHIGSGAAANHTCGIRRDGSVVCWGNNADGQLGAAGAGLKVFVTADIGGPVATATDSPISIHAAEKFTAVQDGSGRYYWVGLTPEGQKSTFALAGSSTVTATGITNLTTTQSYACVRFADGKVRCHNSTSLNKVVTGAALLATIATADPLSFAIYGGYTHACAVQAKGALYCWGSNGYGQLGATPSGTPSDPVPVSGFLVARLGGEQIAVGKTSTCRVYGGKVECWGDNRRGQLGNGNTTASSIPVQVNFPAPAIPIEAVAMGGSHVCALRQDGRVYCWGRNLDGELSNGASSPTQPFESLPRLMPSGWNGTIAISAGNANTCALKADGSILCWGANDRLQSGAAGALQQGAAVLAGSGGTSTASDYNPSTDGYMWLGLGQAHGCAGKGLKSSTAFNFVCWGANRRTERGRPDSPRLGDIAVGTDQDTPFWQSNVKAVASFSAGTYHSCAIGRLSSNFRPTSVPNEFSARELFCWGSDQWKQSTGTGTGTGEFSILSVSQATPTHDANGVYSYNWNGTTLTGLLTPPIAHDAESVEAGLGTCFTQGTTTKCWGRNSDLQQGTGGTAPGTDVLTPTAITVPLNVRALAVGQYHSCAIGSSGEIQCWGRNSEGQVGNGSSGAGVFASTPQPVRGSECPPSLSVTGDDLDPCTRDYCTIGATGPTYTTSLLIGASCNDSLICNGSNQRCVAGQVDSQGNPTTAVCAADPTFTISDGNACTADSCDETRGIVHTPITPVSDNNQCTTDSCNTSTGAPVYTALTGPVCTDLCKFTPSCSSGICSGTQKSAIPDGNPCTVETCNSPSGQVSTPRPKDYTPVAGDNEGQGLCPGGQTCDGAGNCAAPLLAAEVIPDPSQAAQHDNTTPQDSFYDRMKFLFLPPTGYTATQTADTTAISLDADPKRLAVVRGVVRALRQNPDYSKTVTPLAGVKVTVLGQPFAGKTYTRANGEFDMAFYAGGQVTLQFERTGFLPAQRHITLPWGETGFVNDVTLVVPAPSTTVSPLCGAGCTGSQPMQSVSGDLVRDLSGDRMTKVLLPADLTGKIVTGGCTTNCAAMSSTPSISVTEYTRSGDMRSGGGGSDPDALALMPAELPASSAYTYAVELKVAGTPSDAVVQFNKPVPVYLENFLGFTNGTVVPSGYYDRTAGVWKAEANGLVIRIVSITGGLADLDVDGTAGADPGQYAALGISPEERARLAVDYPAPGTGGKSLWRVPVAHFSTHDFNFPGGPDPCSSGGPCPDDPPGGPNPPKPDDCSDQKTGSIIECQNQVLGERLEVAGTPFSLNYRTSRAPGRKIDHMLRFWLPSRSPSQPGPSTRLGFRITATLGGMKKEWAPVASDTLFEQEWPYDKDAYGRLLSGTQVASVWVSEEILGGYQAASSFGQPSPSGARIATGMREVGHIARPYSFPLTFPARGKSDLGGWSLNVNHSFDPSSGVVTLGDGTLARSGGESIRREPPGQLAKGTTFGMAAASNGDTYLTMGRSIQRVAANGAMSLFAGADPTYANSANQFYCSTISYVAPQPQTQAIGFQFSHPEGLAVGPDGSVYVADPQFAMVFRINPQGVISVFAGKQTACSQQTYPNYDPATEGKSALGFQLSYPTDVAVAPDGSVFIADSGNSSRILRVDPAGMITTVAGGSGPRASSTLATGAPVRATAVTFAQGWPRVLATDAQGDVLFTDRFVGSSADSILKVQPDGTLSLVQQLTSPYGDVTSLAIGAKGKLYLSVAASGSGRIYSLADSGVLEGLAGDLDLLSPTVNFQLGGPARITALAPSFLDVARDGRLFFAETVVATDGTFNLFGKQSCAPTCSYISSLSVLSSIRPPDSASPSAVPGGTSGCSYVVPSQSGPELFCFNKDGRHDKTIHAVTGQALLTFNYQTIANKERLTGVVDDKNGTTALLYDSNGNLKNIVGPFQTPSRNSGFTTDANSLIASMTAPDGGQTKFTYQDGLLTSMTDPLGNLFSFEYDQYGLLKKDTDALGNAQLLSRVETATKKTVTHTSPMGRATVYETTQTATGVDKKVTDPDGSVRTVSLAGANKSDQTNADGSRVVTSFIPHPYWGMAAPVVGSQTTTTPLGRTMTTSAAFTGASFVNDLLVSLTKTHTWDPGTPGTLSDDFSETTKFEQLRDASQVVTGMKETQTGALGRQRAWTTDKAGRILRDEVTVVPPPQLVAHVPTLYAYDNFGRPSKVIQGTSDTDGGRRERTFGYGLLTTSADYGQLTQIAVTPSLPAMSSTLTYDPAGRVLTSTVGGGTTTFRWDAANNLQKLITPGGNTHGHSYSALGQLASYSPPTLPLGGILDSRYSYTPDRQLEVEYLPDGIVVTTVRDSATGQLLGKKFPGGGFDYSYYPTSGTCDASSGCARGKLKEVTGTPSSPYAIDLRHEYDSSLLTKRSFINSGANPTRIGEISWTYNNFFQVASERTIWGQSGGTPYDVGFGYDGEGDVACIQTGATSCQPQNSPSVMLLTRRPDYPALTGTTIGATASYPIADTYGQNRFGELTRYVAKRGTETLLELNYEAGSPATERNGDGRVVKVAETRLDTTTSNYHYYYDSVGRLLSVFSGSPTETKVEEYTYDANGNRLSAWTQSPASNVVAGTVAYDAQDRLVRYGSSTFTYNGNGALKSKTDTNTGSNTLYNYDALGNLVAVCLGCGLDGSVLPGGSRITYAVDGRGRRVKRFKDQVLTNEYIYRDDYQIAGTKDAAGNVSRFVYGTKANVPDLMILGVDTYRIISDRLGSPRYVVKVGTGPGSGAAMSIRYDAFGRMTETGLRNIPFGFAGGLYDPDTRLVRFGARDYDPELGRWLAKDPIRWGGGQANLYVYVNNDPVNQIDPAGTGWLECSIATGAAAATCAGCGVDPTHLTCWPCAAALASAMAACRNLGDDGVPGPSKPPPNPHPDDNGHGPDTGADGASNQGAPGGGGSSNRGEPNYPNPAGNGGPSGPSGPGPSPGGGPDGPPHVPGGPDGDGGWDGPVCKPGP